MRLTRYLREECIKLRLETRSPTEEEWEEAREVSAHAVERLRARTKEAVLGELADLFATSDRIGNRNRLLTDLINRERKATTGIGGALAIPHVRTAQAKEFIIAVALAPDGVEFGAIDGEPVRVFVAMVAPPYDDRTYLQVYPRIGELFAEDWMLDALLSAEAPGEVIRLLANV